MPRWIQVPSDNADFQLLETLQRNRKKRQKTGLFLVEGVRNINAAVGNGWDIAAWVVDGRRSLSGWATDRVGQHADTVYSLSPELMARLSGREETSELMALIRMRPDDATPKGDLILVFDRPSNRGNLGSLIRSAEAMGASFLAVTGHAVDLYDPEVVLASTGSFFRLPMARVPGGEPLNQWLLTAKAHSGASIIGTSAHADMPLDAVNLKGPVILLIGNETDGLSRALKELCDVMAGIPFTPGCDATSLNVACAASICLYEINRQRR